MLPSVAGGCGMKTGVPGLRFFHSAEKPFRYAITARRSRSVSNDHSGIDVRYTPRVMMR